VCREVNFSEALYRIAVAVASQVHIDVSVNPSYRMIIKYLSIPVPFSEIVWHRAFSFKVYEMRMIGLGIGWH
jgi:hypothetical protein